MMQSRRIYSTLNLKTCSIQWYINAREGRLGPYASKNQALNQLKSFVGFCVDQGKLGGRHAQEVKCPEDLTYLNNVAQRRS